MGSRRQPDPDLPFLIRRAQAGDEAAFAELVGSCRDRIFRWALVRTGDEDEAEDATQEALVRLHLGLRKFRGASSFETWLYAIVRSAATDLLRKAGSRRRMRDRLARLTIREVPTLHERTVDDLERGRMAAVLRAFLDDLPARQREAVLLVDVEGLGPSEAAERLGSNPATLRTHLFRGRRALRARVMRETGDNAHEL